jgi:hypothetical protein
MFGEHQPLILHLIEIPLAIPALQGLAMELEGQLYYVVEFQHVKPGKGGAFIRTKLKNVKTGAVIERTFFHRDWLLPIILMVIGIVVAVLGMLRERARRRKLVPDQIPAYTKIDLNVPRQRAIFTFVGSFLVVFVLLTAVGSYRAYEFTDSTQFCGQLCHNVMQPEYTAYQNSPHAKVECVKCHIGPGA